MKLHLHLGAHKTATTHFQNVMLYNRHLYGEKTHYEPMDVFREKVTQGSKLLYSSCKEDIEEYLKKLERIKKENLIISEENIIGEAKDIYCSSILYCNMKKRTRRLKCFVSRFEDVTIWFSVRSMDTFIPSIYCESLLHWKFRRFGRVLSGQYNQSWLPVILVLIEIFPNAKINIVLYEKYETSLPKWLEAMTGVKVGWNFLAKERPRESINHLSVNIMSYAHLFIPPAKTQDVLQAMSRYFAKKGRGGKYSPFNLSTKSRLKDLYSEDLEKIRKLGGNICLFEG